MSRPQTPSRTVRSQKLDSVVETEPLSLLNLEELSDDDKSLEQPPSLNKNGKRGDLIAMSEEDDNFNYGVFEMSEEDKKIESWTRLSFPFEMDIGTIVGARPILNKDQTPSKKGRRISWGDSKSNGPPVRSRMEIRFSYPKEEVEDEEGQEETEENGEYECDSSPPIPEKKKKLEEIDEHEEELGVSDEDTSIKKAPKRKYQRKKKVNGEIKETPPPAPPPCSVEDDALLAKDDDSDNERMLMIDEGDQEMEGVGQKNGKKKPRKTMAEIRREKQAREEEKDALLKKVLEKKPVTEKERDEEFELLRKIVFWDSKKKEKEMKSKSVTREEISRALAAAPRMDAVQRGRSMMAEWEKRWMRPPRLAPRQRTPVVISKERDTTSAVSSDEDEMEGLDSENKKKERKKREDLDDMPELDDLMLEYKQSLTTPRKDVEERVVMESDEEGKKEKVKNGKRKNTGGGKGGSTKKKKEEDGPLTEDEVMAEIGRKKADALEKANRMKKQKIEDRERKRIELAKKKEEEEKEREAKKIMKREEREIEIQKKEDERTLIYQKPKSRAEAARRTKKLLALSHLEEEEEETMEEDEPKRKKRKYKRRTVSASFIRRMKVEDDEGGEEGGVGCGKYMENPCYVSLQDEYTEEGLEEEESEGEGDGDGDGVLSVPSLWTSKEDKMPMGAMGPLNFDADESMKGHLSDITNFTDGLTSEYREMVKKLDGMQINLFADTTHRRFDPQVVHNIDFLSKVSTWPIDLLPNPNKDIPKYQFQTWRNKEFKGLVRIRPNHVKADKVASEEIDKMTGRDVVIVTKKDVQKNLEELIMSKLEEKCWSPLPNARNPFDIPEISTRKSTGDGDGDVRRDVKDYRTVSYVEKIHVKSIPCEYLNKKRKKTRKEVLNDIAKKPRPVVGEREDIYKDDGDEEGGGEGEGGYQYEWDEMGEMMENPMRDDQIGGDDPFAFNPYDAVEYTAEDDVDGGEIVDSHYNDEVEGEETQLGEAFSFMATYMDV